MATLLKILFNFYKICKKFKLKFKFNLTYFLQELPFHNSTTDKLYLGKYTPKF